MRNLQPGSYKAFLKRSGFVNRDSGIRGLCGFFLLSVLYPACTIIFLLLIFPVMCNRFESCLNYYTFISVSLVSIIPWMNRVILNLTRRQSGAEITEHHEKGDGIQVIDFLYDITFEAIYGIIWIMTVVFITDAVKSEGWLRTIYISFLLGLIWPPVLKLSDLLSVSFRTKAASVLFSALIPLSVPLGLIMHHPWNYLLFISPLYWASWSWIVIPPAESILYGVIAIVLGVLTGLVAFKRRNVRGKAAV